MNPPIALPRFTIFFRPEQSIVENLEIVDIVEGTRDRMPKVIHGGLPQGVLMEGGGVIFRTPDTKASRGREWHVGFDDFSFIFNHQPRTA